MNQDAPEIIVIRRADDVEDKKKGGVWKIAHADFMTAMMAFFLIMWLVNATDEEIKKSIANYFNPMNLMSAPTDKRGVMEPDQESRPPQSGDEAGQRAGRRPMASDNPGDGTASDGGGNVEVGNENTMASAGILAQTDGPAFNDPYAVLASEASDLAPESPASVDVPQTTVGAEGVTSENADPRDPFDPAYWQTTSPREARTLRPGDPQMTSDIDPRDVIDSADASPRGETYASGSSVTAASASDQSTDAATDAAQSPAPDAAGPRSSVADEVFAALGGAQTDGETTEGADTSPSERAAQEIADALAETGAAVSLENAGGPEEGPILIALTDEAGGVSMFPIGSSEPNPSALAVFQRVADELATREGTIVVRGHTDARPFRSGASDNWVLSFDRAHATKEVLTASGIAEARIARVEGLADREPSRSDDPLAAENRRIEILFEPAEREQ